MAWRYKREVNALSHLSHTYREGVGDREVGRLRVTEGVSDLKFTLIKRD